MKKIFFILSFIFVAISVNAQQFIKATSAGSSVYTYNGTAAKGDTVILNQVKEYVYYTPTLSNTFQAQVTVANVSGTTAARLYVYQSFDNVNYVYVDSATSISGAGKGITTKCTVFAPYVKLKVKGITSTQKTTISKIIAGIKNEQ